MFEVAKYGRINLFACIRIVKIRTMTSGGERRSTSSFNKNYKHVDDISATGFSFGTDTLIVIELWGKLEHLLSDHVKSEVLNDEQVGETVYRQ